MPNKYPEKKGWKAPKQRYKVSNWSDYNESLRNRGRIEIWLCDEVEQSWYEPQRANEGNGASPTFTDRAIEICHQIRQVYHLPLRQTEGFINSLFELMRLPLACPDFSCLSKRFTRLKLKVKTYRKSDKYNSETDTVAIAIDATGLKRFGKDEWHQEKYKISGKRSWRKLHIAVDEHHRIQASCLTDRFVSDDQAVPELISQINLDVSHATADGAYDKGPVYDALSRLWSEADIVIPTDSDAVFDKDNHPKRNRNFREIKTFGRMNWQKARNYGKRNYAEIAIFRYKRTLGNRLHARTFSSQQNETALGCSILNKMASLGMPKSYRCL